MPPLVANGAQLACDLGVSPSPLTVIPGPPHGVTVAPPPTPLATINDHVSLTNIASFGMCMTLANPAVQAATAAASDVFTPAPCVPATPGPWSPPANVQINGIPAMGEEATCQCMWGGTIAVLQPGQAGVVGAV